MKFEENNADFEVPLCKWYKIDKKSPTDFTIVQTSEVTMPPVPIIDPIQKKKPAEMVQAQNNVQAVAPNGSANKSSAATVPKLNLSSNGPAVQEHKSGPKIEPESKSSCQAKAAARPNKDPLPIENNRKKEEVQERASEAKGVPPQDENKTQAQKKQITDDAKTGCGCLLL